jgi:hypothetical protein
MGEVYVPDSGEARAPIRRFLCHQYRDWDQFVLIDEEGFVVSPRTHGHCDPFDRTHQVALEVAVQALRPGLRPGFVLSERDQFFVVVITQEVRHTMLEARLLLALGKRGATELLSGEVIVLGADDDLVDWPKGEGWPRGVELYTRNFVLDCRIEEQVRLQPYALNLHQLFAALTTGGTA